MHTVQEVGTDDLGSSASVSGLSETRGLWCARWAMFAELIGSYVRLPQADLAYLMYALKRSTHRSGQISSGNCSNT